MLLPLLNNLAGSGRVNYSASGLSGTYTLTGQSATVIRARIVAGASGTYTLTGQAATAKYGHVATGASGTYTLTGQAATVALARNAAGSSGTYTLTGTAAGVAYGRKAQGSNGTYVLNGQAANATYTPGTGAHNYIAQGLSGTYYLTGQPALAFYSGHNVPRTDGDEEDRPRKKRKGLREQRTEIAAAIQAAISPKPVLSAASQAFIEAISQVNPELVAQIQDEDDIEALLLLL